MKLLAGKTIESAFRQFSADKEEYRKVIVLFMYLLCAAAASTVGRTAADALFLSRFDSSLLAKMYLPQSAALILTGIVFQVFSSRIRIDRLIKWMIPSLALLVVLSRIGVGLQHNWIFPVIYVAYDVFNFLMIVCFWQFASSILDQRKVKRTIGLVGSGGIVGGIVSGFGLKLIVPWLGTENLIFIYAALQLLALAAVHVLIGLSGNTAELFATTDKKSKAPKSAKTKKRQENDKEGLFRTVPHFKYVAVMSGTLILALTFIDYQFKVILKGELQNEALAGFMGTFYGVSGVLALLVQIFIAGKLLTRFGVTTAILVFPVVLLAGSAGVLLLPVLAMAVIVKGSDKVVGDTINSSVNQLIMFPIPPNWRNRAKSFLDGIVRNGAKGLAAVCLIVLSPLITEQKFSYVIIALLAVCIAAAIKIKGAYLKMLLSTLQKDGSKLDETELDFMDPASVKLLVDALQSPDKQQTLYAFRCLRAMDGFDLAPYLPGLLKHASREVVIETLLQIERDKPEGLEQNLFELLAAADSRVKSQAIQALAAYTEEQFLDSITSYLDENDLEIKSGAIAGLIKYFGIEGMFRAVGGLKPLLESTVEEERGAVAALFGRIGIKEFYKPLIPLLQDESAQVRRLALKSAGILQVPELVPYIVPLLQYGGTRKDAIEALAAYEEKKIIQLLEPYFHRQLSPLHLPKVFERIATPLAFDKLLALYFSSGFEMRGKLLEALIRMLRNITVSGKQTLVIEGLVEQEMALFWQLSEQMSGLSAVQAYGEVVEVAGQIRSATCWRIFNLLALIYDHSTIRAVYANWTEGDVRQQANAMEIMDQLTQGKIRMELAKIMAAPGADMNTARSQAQLQKQLEWLNEQDDVWLRQVIRYAEYPDESDELKDHMDRIRLLRNFSLYQGLTSRELSALAMKLAPVTAGPGDYIFNAKDPGNSLYLVRSGSVGIYRNGEKAGDRKAGESFGQSGVLVHRVRSADAVAEEESLLWRLDSDDFYEVMFDRSNIAIEMMKRLSRRLRTVLAQHKEKPDNAEDTAVEAAAVPAASEMDAKDADAASSFVGKDYPDSLLRRVLILQKIDLFSHLSEDDIVRLAQMVDEVEYEPGETVCQAGDYGDMLYGIIEGTVRIHRDSETLAYLGEGDCFGEMAIIDSGPRSADCTATTPTVLLQLNRDQVFSLCFQNIDVLRSMLQVMGDRLKGMAG